MGDEIDESLVRHIAHLSRLTMDEEEEAAMARELSAIVGYIDQLGQLDTDDVPPTAHALPLQNVFRDDNVVASYDPEVSLSNAPQRENEFFRVPKVLDAASGA